jgi:hypothetical protein
MEAFGDSVVSVKRHMVDNEPMTASPTTPQPSEAEICLDCGFCCDGTLFGKVVAGKGDTTEALVALGLTPVEDSPGERMGFRQPCPHFAGCCSVYASRPHTCAVFRCRLLKSVEAGTYTATQALQKVREVKALRKKLLPVFDAMYADALAMAARPNKHKPSMIGRLRLVVGMMVRPENAQLRDKYGKLLMTAFDLTSRLTNDFLLESGVKKL